MTLHESVKCGIMEGCVSAGISAVATTRSSPQAESKKKSEFHRFKVFLGYRFHPGPCFMETLNQFSDSQRLMQKQLDWLKIQLLVKNPQFLSNQADLQATLPTHELKILRQWLFITGDICSKLIFFLVGPGRDMPKGPGTEEIMFLSAFIPDI